MSEEKVVPLFNRDVLNNHNPSDADQKEEADLNDVLSHGLNQLEKNKDKFEKFQQFTPLLEADMPPGMGVFTPNAYKTREDYLKEADKFRESITDKLSDNIADELKEKIWEKTVEDLKNGKALEIPMDPGGVYVKLDETLSKLDEQGNTLYHIQPGILRIPKNHLGELDLDNLNNVHRYDFDKIPNNLKPMWDEESKTFREAQSMSAADYYINQALLTASNIKEGLMRRLGLSSAESMDKFMGDYERIFGNTQVLNTEGDDPVLKRLVEKYKGGDISDALPDFTQSAAEVNKQAARDMIDGFGVMDRASKDFENILKNDPVAGPAYEAWSQHAFKMDRASQMKASYYSSKLEAVLSTNDELAQKLAKPMENMAAASEIISMIQAQPGSELVMDHLANMRESLFSQADMKALHASTERFSKFFQQVDADSFINKISTFSEEQLENIKKLFDPQSLKKFSEMVSNVVNGIAQKLQSKFGFGEEVSM